MKKLFIVVLACSLVSVGMNAQSKKEIANMLADMEDRINDAESYQNQTDQKIVSLEESIATTASIVYIANASVKGMSDTVGTFNSKIAGQEAQIAAQKAQIEEQNVQIASLTEQMNELKAYLEGIKGELEQKASFVPTYSQPADESAYVDEPLVVAAPVVVEAAQDDEPIVIVDAPVAEEQPIVVEDEPVVVSEEPIVIVDEPVAAPAKKAESKAEKAVAPVSAPAAAPAVDPIAEERSEIISMLQRFYSRDNWDDELSLVTNQGKVKPYMEQYYRNNAYAPKNLRPEDLSVQGKNFQIGENFVVKSLDGDIYCVLTSRGFQIDWEKTFGIVASESEGASLAEYVSLGKVKSSTFNVWITLAETSGITVYSPAPSTSNSTPDMYCCVVDGIKLYVDRTSAAGQKVYKIVGDGHSHQAVVTIVGGKYSDDSVSGIWYRITNIVDGWE